MDSGGSSNHTDSEKEADEEQQQRSIDGDEITLQSTMFVGVVQLKRSGRWGAQLYHTQDSQRYWLGTFNTETDAAVAYDRACIKIHGQPTNFSADIYSEKERFFISLWEERDLLNMIQHHTYKHKIKSMWDELEVMLKSWKNNTVLLGGRAVKINTDPSFLFDMKLTENDLNRLIIPKSDAFKYFPLLADDDEDEVPLKIVDTRSGKEYACTLAYWKSCMTCVLINGWHQFVKERGVRPGDFAIFSRPPQGSPPYHTYSITISRKPVPNAYARYVHQMIMVPDC